MMTNLWMLVALVAGLQVPAPDTSNEKAKTSAAGAEGVGPHELGRPPVSLGLAPFYAKYKSANGLAVVGSAKVSDYAIKEAAYLVDHMLEHRPDVRDAMIRNKT